MGKLMNIHISDKNSTQWLLPDSSDGMAEFMKHSTDEQSK